MRKNTYIQWTYTLTCWEVCVYNTTVNDTNEYGMACFTIMKDCRFIFFILNIDTANELEISLHKNALVNVS